jgi:hypothetical protein
VLVTVTFLWHVEQVSEERGAWSGGPQGSSIEPQKPSRHNVEDGWSFHGHVSMNFATTNVIS